MKRIALTFIGKDRPGIIAEVSGILSESGCNIEDTTMTLLEGQFAMILIASVPSPAIEKKLKKDFDRLKVQWELHYFWKVLPKELVRGEKHPAGTETYVISVMGKDRTGIVHKSTQVLAQAGLNITDLNSKILGEGEKAIFAMVLEADVPKDFRIKNLEPTWKKLRKKLKVDIHIKPLDRLSL